MKIDWDKVLISGILLLLIFIVFNYYMLPDMDKPMVFKHWIELVIVEILVQILIKYHSNEKKIE